jgi:lysophospholipase L1-like esterase
VEVENAGIGDETAEQTVQRLQTALVSKRPDLVLWQVGTNDALKGGSEEAFGTLLRRGIASVQAAGIDLILVDQQFYPSIKDPARYERFVDIVRQTASQHDVPVFSRYALMKAWHVKPAEMSTMLASDGFHMSDRGYDCLAQALSQTLAANVGRREAARLVQPVHAPRPQR